VEEEGGPARCGHVEEKAGGGGWLQPAGNVRPATTHPRRIRVTHAGGMAALAGEGVSERASE
jgi:hypothetical protein